MTFLLLFSPLFSFLFCPIHFTSSLLFCFVSFIVSPVQWLGLFFSVSMIPLCFTMTVQHDTTGLVFFIFLFFIVTATPSPPLSASSFPRIFLGICIYQVLFYINFLGCGLKAQVGWNCVYDLCLFEFFGFRLVGMEWWTVTKAFFGAFHSLSIRYIYIPIHCPQFHISLHYLPSASWKERCSTFGVQWIYRDLRQTMFCTNLSAFKRQLPEQVDCGLRCVH